MTRGLLLVCLLLPACGRAPKARPVEHAEHDKDKKSSRAPEALLYVDGAPRASLTAAELPAGAVGAPLCEYLKQMGAPCSSVRELQLHRDGGAVQSIAAAELRALRLELDGARPRIGGAPVRNLAVFVDKTAPLPLEETMRGGTRVNVDGRLSARLKRNQLDGSLPEVALVDGEPQYALADFLEQRKLPAPRAIELVTADQQVVRIPDGEVAKLRFSAERQRHGQMSFHYAGRSTSAVAVNLYVTSAPPLREPARPKQAGFSAGCDVTSHGEAGSALLVLMGGTLILVARRRWS